MVFSSIIFLFRFLPIVLAIYFVAPGKMKNLVLFLGSLVFYAWGEPVYVVLMLFSTVVDYSHGLLVDKFLREDKKDKAKMVVISSVVINLFLLCFFKYADFLIITVNNIFSTTFATHNLALPIGISFYTFQTMSYTIDVYRGDAKVQKNIVSFGAYVALFPQLIAGPIVQYKTIDEQLNNRKVTIEGFAYGIKRFVMGLSKKVLLANNIGMLWDDTMARFLQMGSLSVLGAWMGAIAFAFQIYFDFSGYSDMAIGLGAMFGFRFKENFNYPYQADCITDFWRRWHISLGTWFREYVYIPLGGNRVSRIKFTRNILVVWALTGIWHGASWNFAVWGLYFGVILVFEKFVLGKYLKKIPPIFAHIYTLIIVLISWVIFAFDSLKCGVSYIGMMFGASKVLTDDFSIYNNSSYFAIFLILIVASTDLPRRLYELIKDKCSKSAVMTIALDILLSICLISLFILSIAFIVDSSYNPFLYFRF